MAAVIVVVGVIVGLAPWRGVIADDQPARSSPAAKAAYTAAAALQNRGAWDLASEAWETLLRDHPRDPLAAKGRYYLGLCRLQEGKWPEAAAAFRSVVEGGGKDGGADLETVGLARFELGRGAFARAQEQRTVEAYRDAAGALRECLAANPGPGQVGEVSYLLAEALWQAGDRPAALDGWQRFIADHAASPRLPAVLYALGVAQTETGDPVAAAATLRRFAETFPDDALADEVAIRRSDLALAADQPAEAAKLVVEIARRKDGPRIGDALERLGAALWKQQRYAAAAQAYDILVARDPGGRVAAPALLSASAAWSEAGNVEEARQRLEQLIALESAPAAVVAEGGARLTRMHLAAGRTDDAVALANRMLALGAASRSAGGDGETIGDGLIARLQLAAAEGLVDLPNRRDEGLALLARLVADHPDDPTAAPGLALQSSVLLAAGRSDEAIASADRFLALPAAQRGQTAADLTTLNDVRAIRAEALLTRGDAAASADAFRELVSTAGDDPRAAHLQAATGKASKETSVPLGSSSMQRRWSSFRVPRRRWCFSTGSVVSIPPGHATPKGNCSPSGPDAKSGMPPAPWRSASSSWRAPPPLRSRSAPGFVSGRPGRMPGIRWERSRRMWKPGRSRHRGRGWLPVSWRKDGATRRWGPSTGLSPAGRRSSNSIQIRRRWCQRSSPGVMPGNDPGRRSRALPTPSGSSVWLPPTTAE
jgi:TolA-binding protein